MHRTHAALAVTSSHAASRHIRRDGLLRPDRADPRVDEALKLLLAIGAMLVLLLPSARGSVASIGWLPMWLLGMPAVALWASRGFALPGRKAPAVVSQRTRRGRTTPQARRRPRPLAAAACSRAA